MKDNLIIFDCFGVITSEIASIWFANRYSKPEAQRLKAEYFLNADLGYISIGELVTNLSKGLNIPKETIIREWDEIFCLNLELIDWIEKINKDNHVIVLSNAPKGLVESIFEKYDLYKLFEDVHISCNYHIAKPDIRLYKRCIECYGNMKNIYMIDDNPKNLCGLDQLNIKAVHYTDYELLLAYFEKESIL